MSEFTDHYFDFDGITLHYVEAGSGPLCDFLSRIPALLVLISSSNDGIEGSLSRRGGRWVRRQLIVKAYRP